MDIDTLDKICNDITVDISMANGSEGFFINTTGNSYIGYSKCKYKNCNIVDRYCNNIKLIDPNAKRFRNKDRMFPDKSTTVPIKDGLIIKKTYFGDEYYDRELVAQNDEESYITRDVIIKKYSFNMDKLRRILLSSNKEMSIITDLPIYIDGPLFDDVMCKITLRNVTLGPVAMMSYSSLLRRLNIDSCILINELMYQDHLHLLEVSKLTLTTGNYNLPLLPINLRKLTINSNHACRYLIAQLPNLHSLTLNGPTVMLAQLPLLRKLNIRDAEVSCDDTIISNLSELTVSQTSTKVRNYLNLDTYEGEISQDLLFYMPDIKKITTSDDRILGSLASFVSDSIEELVLDNDEFDVISTDQELIDGFLVLMNKPNIRKMSYIIGPKYPFDIFDNDILLSPVIPHNVMHYNQQTFKWELPDSIAKDIDKINRHNKLVRKRNVLLSSLSYTSTS